MSNERPDRSWHGPKGEWLVAIQFAIFFAFVLSPTWSPDPLPGLLATSAPLPLGVLVACWIVALAFGVGGVIHLRDLITPLPYPVDHSRLITHGVYGVVRHPLYSSQLFAAVGWVAYTGSLPHLALLAAGFVFFDYKAGKEEGWLTARHPEYPDYARRVRKLVPWVY